MADSYAQVMAEPIHCALGQEGKFWHMRGAFAD